MTPQQKANTRHALIAILTEAMPTDPPGRAAIAARSGLTTRCIDDTLHHGVIDGIDLLALLAALELDPAETIRVIAEPQTEAYPA